MHRRGPRGAQSRQGRCRAEHTDLVQVKAALPAQGQMPVLQPDALFAPAVVRTHQQGGKHSSDHQQRHREGGQGVAGYRCQQQAQPAGDAGRQKKRRDAAACGVHRGFWRQDKAGQQPSAHVAGERRRSA